MGQIFTGGRSDFFFLLKIFTRKSGRPTSTFQEQGTVALVALVALLPEERLCQSRPGRACVLDGWQRTCNELESAVSSFFRSSSA